MIGSEKRLADIIKKADIMPLLQGAVHSGALMATLKDINGEILYQYGDITEGADLIFKKPVYLEGEIAGHIIIDGDSASESHLEAIGELISDAVGIIIRGNFEHRELTDSLDKQVLLPLGVISSNINTLEHYISILKKLLALYRNLMDKKELTEEDREKTMHYWKTSKLDFIFSDVEDLIQESLNEADRIKKIVVDLQGSSHIDEAGESAVDFE